MSKSALFNRLTEYLIFNKNCHPDYARSLINNYRYRTNKEFFSIFYQYNAYFNTLLTKRLFCILTFRIHSTSSKITMVALTPFIYNKARFTFWTFDNFFR